MRKYTNIKIGIISIKNIFLHFCIFIFELYFYVVIKIEMQKCKNENIKEKQGRGKRDQVDHHTTGRSKMILEHGVMRR